MSEEEIIDKVMMIDQWKVSGDIYTQEELNAIGELLDLYNKEKEKNKEKVIFKNASIKIGDKDLKDILENYILKSKIKEKIEELKNEKDKYFEKQVIQGKIDLLEELLKGE